MKNRTTTTTTTESRLRKVLLLNVEFSLTTGLAALIFGGPIADLLGIEQVWLVRALGAGLLGFAGLVFLVARSSSATLAAKSFEVSIADIGWVLGTIVVIALGWLSTSGAIVMAVIGLAVLALGLAQMHARQQLV